MHQKSGQQKTIDNAAKKATDLAMASTVEYSVELANQEYALAATVKPLDHIHTTAAARCRAEKLDELAQCRAKIHEPNTAHEPVPVRTQASGNFDATAERSGALAPPLCGAAGVAGIARAPVIHRWTCPCWQGDGFVMRPGRELLLLRLGPDMCLILPGSGSAQAVESSARCTSVCCQ